MEFQYTVGSQTYPVVVEPGGDGYTVTLNGCTYAITATPAPGRPGELVLTLDGAQQLAWVAADGPRRWVALDGQAASPVVVAVPQASGRQRRGPASGDETLEAQMPGVVRRVLVAQGDAVERGQVLVLLEAMKMEIRVSAPRAGVVAAVGVAEGQAVERGQTLVTLVSRGQSE
jgi:3-methylcrotonyl-CoA carboxylase alpha subunit